MSDIFSFITTQVLGMKWLNDLIGNILTFFNIDITDTFGGTLHFFIYDIIKIVVLLFQYL